MVDSRSSSDMARVFIGRHREMAELRSAWDDALSGRGRLVMLAGEPGIGKTRMAQELSSHAASLGAQIFWGWCYEQEGAPHSGLGSSLSATMYSNAIPSGCNQ
jgi:hypothetical protein